MPSGGQFSFNAKNLYQCQLRLQFHQAFAGKTYNFLLVAVECVPICSISQGHRTRKLGPESHYHAGSVPCNGRDIVRIIALS